MRPTRHFGFLSGLALLGTAALGSTAALATAPTETPSLTVNYAQSDLQDSASAEALYQRAGFRVTGERKSHLANESGRVADHRRMERVLD